MKEIRDMIRINERNTMQQFYQLHAADFRQSVVIMDARKLDSRIARIEDRIGGIEDSIGGMQNDIRVLKAQDLREYLSGIVSAMLKRTR